MAWLLITMHTIRMAKKNPFDYVKSINWKTYEYDLVGYVPFLTNRCFAMHMDTIMFAEEMNQRSSMNPAYQYDFYYYAVRKGKRFGFPPKVEQYEDLEVVMRYFQYSRQKATEVIRLLTEDDITSMKNSFETGGQ